MRPSFRDDHQSKEIRNNNNKQRANAFRGESLAAAIFRRSTSRLAPRRFATVAGVSSVAAVLILSSGGFFAFGLRSGINGLIKVNFKVSPSEKGSVCSINGREKSNVNHNYRFRRIFSGIFPSDVFSGGETDTFQFITFVLTSPKAIGRVTNFPQTIRKRNFG